MAFLHRNHTSFCLGKNENRCTVQSLETGTTFSKASYLTSAILESSSQMPTQNLKKSAFFRATESPQVLPGSAEASDTLTPRCFCSASLQQLAELCSVSEPLCLQSATG